MDKTLKLHVQSENVPCPNRQDATCMLVNDSGVFENDFVQIIFLSQDCAFYKQQKNSTTF